MTVRAIREALRAAPDTIRPRHALPAGCPVTPLGKAGHLFYYLNALGELVSLDAQKHSRNHLAALFAPNIQFLRDHWPRLNRDGEPTDQFRPEKVADALMQACAAIGVWTPDAAVRGRGAWAGRDGDLILHLGDCLWVRGRAEPCGLRDEWVYPVLPRRPHPVPDPQPGGEDGPAAELLAILRSWAWRRPHLDPVLMLGWVCAAIVGGALEWRPAVWLTGDRGTGKTTLQELIRQLLVQNEGIYSLSDTTAAGIRQRARHDSLPVAFDEAEADDDNAKVLELVQLARLASSGGVILRGGQDHQGSEFTVRFATLYSSILMPPLRAQDLSRIAVLQLQPLPAGSRAPRLDREGLGLLGRRLMRRMSDRWPALTGGAAPVLETWQAELRARGLDHRGAAQFGTLLACADVALHDHPPDGDSLAGWCDTLLAATDDDRADEVPDWRRCLAHLTSSLAAQWRGGEQRTVGTLIAIAAGRKVLGGEFGDTAPGPLDRAAANDALAALGLRVLDGDVLAVANDHRGLADIFAGTHWQRRSGASGVWRQALLRVPGARPSEGAIRFRGPQARAVLVPLDYALGEA